MNRMGRTEMSPEPLGHDTYAKAYAVMRSPIEALPLYIIVVVVVRQ